MATRAASCRVAPLRTLNLLDKVQRSRCLPLQIRRIGADSPRKETLDSCSQCRHASTSSGSAASKPKPPPPSHTTASVGVIVRRLVDLRTLRSAFGARNLRRVFNLRTLGLAFGSRNLRGAWQQNPGELITALILLAGSAGVVGVTVWTCFSYFWHEQFTRYPPPIAKALRRALYFTNYKPDPEMALKNYQRALQLCEEFRLDPFSDDVMGIKIQMAAWLERIGNYDNATRVLETLLEDCRRWVGMAETSFKEGTVPLALLPPTPVPTAVQGAERERHEVVQQPEAPRETLWGKRSRILGKAVGISVKLGDLYASKYILKTDLAHQHLTWAVETALGELQRRKTQGTRPGEGPWMSPEAIGATVESLGHNYEAKSQFHLAIPLFFQALRLCQDQCHMAVLMNNIAASFAQHPVLAAADTPLNAFLDEPLAPASATPQETRRAYLAAAKRWAYNARQHATEVGGNQRTRECDEACAAALCTLADIARIAGEEAEARRLFETAAATSRQVDYTPGLTQATTGLRQLAGEA